MHLLVFLLKQFPFPLLQSLLHRLKAEGPVFLLVAGLLALGRLRRQLLARGLFPVHFKVVEVLELILNFLRGVFVGEGIQLNVICRVSLLHLILHLILLELYLFCHVQDPLFPHLPLPFRSGHRLFYGLLVEFVLDEEEGLSENLIFFYCLPDGFNNSRPGRFELGLIECMINL